MTWYSLIPLPFQLFQPFGDIGLGPGGGQGQCVPGPTGCAIGIVSVPNNPRP